MIYKTRSFYSLFPITLLIFAILVSDSIASDSKQPFADIHIHYNWDQEELITAKDAVKKLDANNIVLAVVSSVPTNFALKLAKERPGRIIPLFSPYITVESRRTWFRDNKVLAQAKQGIESGDYQGIGELHLWDGMEPRLDNKILIGLLRLAEKHDVPLLIHTESSRADYFLKICQKYSRVRFLWAHAGGRLMPNDIKPLMRDCPNVWIEVSARDPWRYDTFVQPGQPLTNEWKDLIMSYPDRVMTGSDPVWNVRRTQSWDEADTGWDHIDQLINYHRLWLKTLPDDIEKKIRLENAKTFFKQYGK